MLSSRQKSCATSVIQRRRILRALLAGLFGGCAAPLVPPAAVRTEAAGSAHWRGAELEIGGGQVALQWDEGDFAAGAPVIRGWVTDAAGAVALYFGRFPVPRVTLRIESINGRGVGGGTTWGSPEPLIVLRLGRAATAGDLARDWILPHEMVHLAMPELHQRHHWLEEGLATYVEPIARIQAGHLPSEDMWRDLVRGLPNGLPLAGDRGLDFSHSWGRTYWGGALFLLLAEIDIRRRSNNRHGLQDGLRAVVAGGGSIARHWPIERVLEVADAATGQTVLRDLYAEMSAKPKWVNLPKLFSELGVSYHNTRLSFDDTAPDAAIRLAVTAAPRAA
jgi:hypothetical protein